MPLALRGPPLVIFIACPKFSLILPLLWGNFENLGTIID
jgi:hypothetical protein